MYLLVYFTFFIKYPITVNVLILFKLKVVIKNVFTYRVIYEVFHNYSIKDDNSLDIHFQVSEWAEIFNAIGPGAQCALFSKEPFSKGLEN